MKIALVINTISKNNDVWKAFFDRLDRHIPEGFFHKKYVFVDDDLGAMPAGYDIVKYDSTKKYQEQFSSCIESVKEEYCIYISEDYILYENVRIDLISDFVSLLSKESNLSFIRLMKGGLVDVDYPKYKRCDNIHHLYNEVPYFYTNQAALWRTEKLKLIHKKGPDAHIANVDWENSFEFKATKTCQELGIRGSYCYYGEQKRGLYHYDSIVFPHISTALVKGKWNLAEYPDKMATMIKEYNIDINKRGFV